MLLNWDSEAKVMRDMSCLREDLGQRKDGKRVVPEIKTMNKVENQVKNKAQ